MRKGRSSRRSRSSRPLIGAKSGVDVLSTELGSVGNPRVVVGVPPSNPPPAADVETPSIEAKGTVDVPVSAKGIDPLDAFDKTEKASSVRESESETEKPAATLASFGTTVALGSPDTDPAVQAASAASSAAAAEAEKEETGIKSFASTLAVGSLSTEPEADETQDEPRSVEPDFATTLALGSASVDAVAVQARGASASAEPVAAEPPRGIDESGLSRPHEDVGPLPESLRVEANTDLADNKVTVAAKKAKKKKKNATPPVSVDPDEISVPPVGGVSVDDEFFSDGDITRHLDRDPLEGDALTVPDKARRKAQPHVVERRARFVRYVKWAVAGAAVMCVAALARTTMSSSSSSSVRSRAAMTMEAPVVAKAAASAASPIAEPAAAAPASAAPPPEPAPTTTPQVAEPAAATPTTSPSAETRPEESPTSGDAKEEKKTARTMLEKQKIAEAIEAGERAVKLDPTDGEAWLILGAAYQEKGNIVEARRAYSSCVKEATTGPLQECGKMLR